MSRSPNTTTDIHPSIGHHYNASVISPYLKKNWQVLDIGCWTGQLYRAFSTSPSHYFGLDIEPTAIVVAKQLSPSGHWRAGSALKLPYRAKTFDLVTLLDVLEHLPKDSEAVCLEQIVQVLRPQGLLIFSTPADNLISKLADPAYFLMGHRHYSQPQLTALFSQAGLVIQQHWTTGGWWHTLYYWLHLFYKHVLPIAGPTFETQASAELSHPGFLTHYFVLRKA